jgi:hypothetical protein
MTRRSNFEPGGRRIERKKISWPHFVKASVEGIASAAGHLKLSDAQPRGGAAEWLGLNPAIGNFCELLRKGKRWLKAEGEARFPISVFGPFREGAGW